MTSPTQRTLAKLKAEGYHREKNGDIVLTQTVKTRYYPTEYFCPWCGAKGIHAHDSIGSTFHCFSCSSPIVFVSERDR